MSKIRPCAVAGSFYSSDPVQLRSDVEQMLASDHSTRTNLKQAVHYKAIIAPHAGLIYSGAIAASIYATLSARKDAIRRVVLLGPSHRVAFRGIAACTHQAYHTPLGDVEIDQEAIRAITALPNVGYLDEAHRLEHSLEVHLPFLQCCLQSFALVPLVVGDAPRDDVARVLDKLWGDDQTLVVISSDLSHFHPYDEAQILDLQTSRKILNLDSNLTGDEACGCRPINGLLHLAQQRGFSVEQIDVRNSGDTAGTADRVVGYGSYGLHQTTGP